MMPRVPDQNYAAPDRPFDDPQMLLQEAVSWVAYRGGGRPWKGGLYDGDRSVEDQKLANQAADDVRQALADGRILAHGRLADGTPIVISAASWSKQFGLTVSELRFRLDDYELVTVACEQVLQLWPADDDAPERTMTPSAQQLPTEPIGRGRPKTKRQATLDMATIVAKELGSTAQGQLIVRTTLERLEKQGIPCLSYKEARLRLVQAGIIRKGG